jgi:hypothetical protein
MCGKLCVPSQALYLDQASWLVASCKWGAKQSARAQRQTLYSQSTCKVVFRTAGTGAMHEASHASENRQCRHPHLPHWCMCVCVCVCVWVGAGAGSCFMKCVMRCCTQQGVQVASGGRGGIQALQRGCEGGTSPC